MSKNTVRHFYSLFAPTTSSSMAFQDVRVTLARCPTVTAQLLLGLRLLKVGGPAIPKHRGKPWAKERVAVRETTEEERRLYYDLSNLLDWENLPTGWMWTCCFPPSPPAQDEPAHGVILVHFGLVNWEQPVKAGEEALAVDLLKQRVRGETDYMCDFHGLFRTTKPVEGDSNDVPPPVKPAPRLPRKKPKPKPKRQSRTKLG